MKNILVGGSSVLLSTFLLVGCGAGACCEDGVEVLSTVQPKSIVTVEDTNSVTIEERRSDTTEFSVPNIPPYVIAHANDSLEMLKISTCQTVHFDADSSYDPDGNDQNLSYLWSNEHSLIVSDERAFNHRYDKKGLYEMTLIVVDEDNLTAVDRVCVLVNIDEDELPLIAKAGGNLEVNSHEKVSLSGRGFCRDDILKYEWKEGSNLLSSEASFENTFEAGKHTLLFTIEDFEGNRATDSIVINVL